ncbi:hypothetical protein NHX12_002852 [Muraenolepis orangiensis]|uniref:Link domain-containing protein n=1 Tax=Muraenolepis orangiensis TaxID=630683 RepID=A0A9Q0DWX8_9TELE|nr:hypothetical protein NHX12_002852 [Muraenolepis orangiensis]
MWLLLLGVTFGLLAPTRSDQPKVTARSCSYARVFQVEQVNRYSLDFNKATELCQQLGGELATNGWLSNKTFAILRHTHHENCAKNTTGFIIHAAENLEELHDAYCYNSKAGPDENCEQRIVGQSPYDSDSDDVSNQTRADNHTDVGVPDVSVDKQAEPETPSPRPAQTDLQPSRPAEREDTTGGYIMDRTTAPPATMTGMEGVAGSGMLLPTSEEDFSHPTAEGHLEETDTTSSGKVGPEAYPNPQDTEVPRVNPESGTEPEVEIVTGENASPEHPIPKNRMIPMATPSTPSGDEGSNKVVIIGVLVAVAAVLLIFAAIAKRNSWCGKRRSLIITSKDSGSEGNGAPAVVASSRAQEREQEMVTLMNKEKIQENGKGGGEEFTVITLEESSDKEQQGA